MDQIIFLSFVLMFASIGAIEKGELQDRQLRCAQFEYFRVWTLNSIP